MFMFGLVEHDQRPHIIQPIQWFGKILFVQTVYEFRFDGIGFGGGIIENGETVEQGWDVMGSADVNVLEHPIGEVFEKV